MKKVKGTVFETLDGHLFTDADEARDRTVELLLKDEHSNDKVPVRMPRWESLEPGDRGAILEEFRDLLLRRAEEFIEVLSMPVPKAKGKRKAKESVTKAAPDGTPVAVAPKTRKPRKGSQTDTPVVTSPALEGTGDTTNDSPGMTMGVSAKYK